MYHERSVSMEPEECIGAPGTQVMVSCKSATMQVLGSKPRSREIILIRYAGAGTCVHMDFEDRHILYSGQMQRSCAKAF